MYIAIVNPVSGGGRSERVLSEVEAELARRRLRYRVERTAGSQSAVELARSRRGVPRRHHRHRRRRHLL